VLGHFTFAFYHTHRTTFTHTYMYLVYGLHGYSHIWDRSGITLYILPISAIYIHTHTLHTTTRHCTRHHTPFYTPLAPFYSSPSPSGLTCTHTAHYLLRHSCLCSFTPHLFPIPHTHHHTLLPRRRCMRDRMVPGTYLGDNTPFTPQAALHTYRPHPSFFSSASLYGPHLPYNMFLPVCARSFAAPWLCPPPQPSLPLYTLLTPVLPSYTRFF